MYPRILSLFAFGPLAVALFTLLSIPVAWVLFSFVEFILGNGDILTINRFTLAALFVANIAWVYLGGFREIKPAHVGQVLILGSRIESFYFPEGSLWALPKPLMDFKEESAEVRTTKVEKDEDPIHALSDDGISIDVKASVQWNLRGVRKGSGDLAESLYAFTSTNPRTISEGLFDAMRNAVREYIAEKPASILLGVRDFDSVEKDENQGEAMKELGRAIEAKAQEFAERWGIEILKAIVTKIVPTNAEVVAAYEKRKTEKLQQDGEAKEISALTGFMDTMDAKYGKTVNRPEGLTPQAIANLVQAERGKARRIVIDGSEKSGFVRAQVASAILSQEGGKK